MPKLLTVLNSDEEIDSIDGEAAKDCFSDVGDDWDNPWGKGYSTDELSGVDSEGSLLVNIDLESVGEKSCDLSMDQDSPV